MRNRKRPRCGGTNSGWRRGPRERAEINYFLTSGGTVFRRAAIPGRLTTEGWVRGRWEPNFYFLRYLFGLDYNYEEITAEQAAKHGADITIPPDL